MNNKVLHVLFGDEVRNEFLEANLEGDVIIFREALCQGECQYPIFSEKFWNQRIKFFTTHYDFTLEEYMEFSQNKIEELKNYLDDSLICLWFDYTLYSHINVFSIISFLDSSKKTNNVHFVCSGLNFGSQVHKSLGELNADDIKRLFSTKRALSKIDFEFANYFWMIYQSDKHNELYSFTFHEHPTFAYLKDCMIAHFYRYPNRLSGLSYSQEIILEQISEQPKGKEEIVEKLIETQGFYGFRDFQYYKMIKDLDPLYINVNGHLKINENGRAVLSGEKHLSEFVEIGFKVGGTKFTDYYFENNRLHRSIAQD